MSKYMENMYCSYIASIYQYVEWKCISYKADISHFIGCHIDVNLYETITIKLSVVAHRMAISYKD